jgi:TetR/AcrR family transcriptional regulator, lmrAB and yxaGH operons repressor
MTTTTRDRIVQAMSASIQARGMNATGLNDLVRDAGAPKGVLYHHFPGGKAQITIAAIDESIDRLEARLERAIARGDDLLDALATWLERAADGLRDSSFTLGCPLATVALETTADDAEIRAALDRGFARLRAVITAGLQREGRTEHDAERMAFAIVAAYEGGLLQARVSGRIEPMVEACRFVLDLMRQRS